MLYLDVDALQEHGHDPYLTDILLGLDLSEPTGRRLRAAFPEFYTQGDAPQVTPWSFLRRRFNILESYGHEEPTAATLRYFNLPLEEFFSRDVPAVWDVFQDRSDTYEYNGLVEQQPRILTLKPEAVDGEEARFYVLEIVSLDDTPDEDGILVFAVSLQYLDLTR